MIHLLGIGSRVTVGGGEAVVIQACVGAGDHVTYQVAYWHGGDRKTAWVEACEVGPLGDGGAPALRIGFGPAGGAE